MSLLKTFRLTIAEEISKYRTPEEIEAFLEDILTPSEIEVIEERIRILHALAKGKTQRDVAQREEASIATVSRGAKTLKYGRIGEGWRK